ncbi:aromatic ring-hydroxylating oxygenase subunit alpha [Pseudomonas aeruginosa]|uniref:aromatic ring-hydroxylating oxygenase subunit alpha n=1 Tax=Pseudomonas aeruginosa TaxID=287 RepID=UPI00053D6BA4|nr:SRPBCC family protein [Pseudomonas aeruginosa]
MNAAAQPAAIRYHRLNDLTASQIAAIRSIPSHDQGEVVPIKATRPASMFLDEGFYQREQERVFRRLPLAITVSAMLPEPGSLFAHDGYGLPLLVVRDRDGKVRVLLNDGEHKLATPAGVSRGETFEAVEKNRHDLAELPSKEAGGLIWAILDRNAEPDFSHLNDEVIADLDALELGRQYLYGHKTFEVASNWKQINEPFLEGYHVQRLHANSVGPLFADVPTVVSQIGDHIRQISGKLEFAPGGLENEKNIHKTITHAYMLFPNTVVITSPYYMSLMIIIPTAVGTSLVDYHMLTLNPADNPKSQALYQTSYETVLGVFGNEDFKAAEWCQKGLQSGALDEVGKVYSGLECAIPMQYDTLDKYLEASPDSAPA